LVDRVMINANGATFRFDDAEVFEFWLQARYSLEELRGIVEQIEAYRKAHPDEVKRESPRLFTG